MIRGMLMNIHCRGIVYMYQMERRMVVSYHDINAAVQYPLPPIAFTLNLVGVQTSEAHASFLRQYY